MCLIVTCATYVADAIIIIIIIIILHTYVYLHLLCTYVAGRTETEVESTAKGVL